MKRLLAILVLAGASAQAQPSSYSDVIGTVPNLLFYKNQKSQENQITSVASSSSFQARYGYWDFHQNTFSALWPDFYLPGNSLLSSDPDYLTVSIDPSSGVAALSGVVHPFIPELLNDPTSTPRPYAPPGPNQAQDRSEILQGMLLALNHLDGVIELLRQAPDGSAAKIGLRERFMLSDRQCDAILGMPLRRLTSLERQNLETEFAELTDRMQELNNLLENRHDRLKTLKKDLRSLKRRFGDQRRTRIQHPPNLPTQAPTPQLTPPHLS